jgi:nicotinamide-nucleotide amidase
MKSLEQEVGDLLRQRGLTLGLVESATGGLISHVITNVPGSSDYYKGSVIAYSNMAKISLVGVKEQTIKKHGAVSPQVAEEMAQGGRRVLDVDICLADTGIAGPGGATPGKPVGLFYIGLSHQNETYSRKHNFRGDREQNKKAAAEAVLLWLKEYLLGIK